MAKWSLRNLLRMDQRLLRTIIGLAVILLVWMTFIGVLRRAGFLSMAGKDSANVTAAAVTLVGAFLGTLVSLLGLVLKLSLEERTEQRLQLESARNGQLQRDAERRLTLEAGLRAVQLFANQDGTASLPIQRAGALFTLASLGQHELTLSLIDELLPAGQIEPETAASLINRALVDGLPGERRKAINVLDSHVSKMVNPTSTCFPESILDWELHDDIYLREWSATALGKLLLARPVSEWQQRKFEANAILAGLGLGWLEEKHERVKLDLGAILRWALVAFPDVGVLYHPRKEPDLEVIRSEIQEIEPEGHSAAVIVDRLKVWCGGDASAAHEPSIISAS